MVHDQFIKAGSSCQYLAKFSGLQGTLTSLNWLSIVWSNLAYTMLVKTVVKRKGTS